MSSCATIRRITALGTGNCRPRHQVPRDAGGTDDALTAGAGVMFQIGDDATVMLDYEGVFLADGNRQDYVGLRLGWDF